MNPKNLRAPFRWNERRVLLRDRVWHVPVYYDRYEEFTFPGWEHPDFFGNVLPIAVEYCSGNGDWIVERASKTRGTQNWVAVEKRFDRVRKIWSKMQNLQLDNLLIICGEAHLTTKLYFPTDSVQEIYINFPDPWPKGRHIKHRLIHSAFVGEMGRVLKSDAPFTFVSDDLHYVERLCEEMQNHQETFKAVFPAPHYVYEWPGGYGASWFDALWRREGRQICYVQYRRK